jgi:hypothetical protein
MIWFVLILILFQMISMKVNCKIKTNVNKELKHDDELWVIWDKNMMKMLLIRCVSILILFRMKSIKVNSNLSISFETKSELTCIKSYSFSSSSSLKSFTIPRHLQIFCSYCFSYCELLSSISFNTESELAQIEVDAFYSTSLSVSSCASEYLVRRWRCISTQMCCQVWSAQIQNSVKGGGSVSPGEAMDCSEKPEKGD